MTWEWLTCWWDAFSSSQDLFVIVCFDCEKSPVAIVPLYRVRLRMGPGVKLRVLRFVGDGTFDSDNLDLIIRQGYELEAVKVLLDWLSARRSEWDLLQLNAIPSNSIAARMLGEELAERRWDVLRREGPHAVIPLPNTWKSYLDSLSKKMRSSLLYEIRRLESQYRVCPRRCQTELDLAPSLERLFDLHTQRWSDRGQGGSFSVPGRRRFYTLLAKEFLTQGWLNFWLLDLNDRTVAAEFGFRYGDTHVFLQGGFDTGFTSQSVGNALRVLILRELIQEGARFYDFLGGGDDYKLRWGAQLQSYLYLTCAPRWTRGGLHLRLTRAAGKGKEWVRTRTPASAWDLLRRTYRRFRPYQAAAAEGLNFIHKVDPGTEKKG